MYSYDLTEHDILPNFHNRFMAFKIHVIAKVRLVHGFFKQTILLSSAATSRKSLEVVVVKMAVTLLKETLIRKWTLVNWHH